MKTVEKVLADLRRARDEAAERGDYAEAMILNDRVLVLKALKLVEDEDAQA